MPSAALKILLLCDLSNAKDAGGRPLERRVERWEGEILRGDQDRALCLFDLPRQALGCAFALLDRRDGNAAAVRVALHLGEVRADGEPQTGQRAGAVDEAAAETLERLLGLALEGQILVSAVIEGTLRSGSLSGGGAASSATAAAGSGWRWT
ncbi:MAG: hypothetical protein AAF725_13730, partial [Acidobacteriota bacterium]